MPGSSPFPGLQKLSPSVYLWEPPSSHSTATPKHPAPSPPPKLILLFTWMSAQPIHISKYIHNYQTHYPTSRILVIRSSPLDGLYHRTSTQHRRLTPAVHHLLASLQPTTPTNPTPNPPELLIHLFSNGGSLQFSTFLATHRQTTHTPFPPHIKILDSCPGRATFRRTILAFASPFSASPLFIRFPTLLLIYLLLGIYFLAIRLRLLADPVLRVRGILNAVRQGEERRCYIYSTADPMVGWRDVEAHAVEAGERGCRVRRERFGKTGHCAHVREGGGG
ncbi:MAG: hypothetical protein LQ349_005305, partial [Xanthoria aureola]